MTKDDLVETAIRLWKEKGYRNVSVNEICRECGVTKGSYYHHFSSKKELLFYYYKISVIRKYAESRSEIENQDSRIESVKMIFELFTSSILQFNNDMILSILSKNDDYNIFDEQYFDDVIPEIIPTCVSNHIERGILTGEIRSGYSPAELINYLSAALLGNILQWCYQNQSFDLYASDRNLIDLILKK